MSAVSCGGISALSLGLPDSSALPSDKGTLPKQMFYVKVPVSTKLKQRFVNDITEISLLSLLRPGNTRMAEGARVREILVMGLGLNNQELPVDVIEHICRMRSSAIIFVCIRDHQSTADSQKHSPSDSGKECSMAVRRALPGRAGHVQQLQVFNGDWMPADQARLRLVGQTMDDLWESLNAQIILNSTNAVDLDQRIAVKNQITLLKAEEQKLSKDHSRVKNPEQRNQIYAKLHKVRTQLAQLNG